MEIETTHGDEVLVGNFHYINEGEYICAEGEYVDHPAHGPQYRMTSYTVKEPEDKAAMERYLASGAIKGMGPALAARVIKKFKGNTFDIIESEPERLAEVKGISLKKAMDIAVQFQDISWQKILQESDFVRRMQSRQRQELPLILIFVSVRQFCILCNRRHFPVMFICQRMYYAGARDSFFQWLQSL